MTNPSPPGAPDPASGTQVSTTGLPDLTAPHHHLSINTAVGALHLQATLDLHAPWTVLFGPSGSGKTTLLRAIAGLLQPRPSSQWSMDPRPETPTLKIERLQPTITDLSAKPPHKRSLAYAPQDAALFPHLTVRENIRFPFQVHAEPLLGFTLVEDAIDLFHLHTLAERLPHSLSGGEAQRVALARAFATPSACLLLLDEPFAGLDLALRDELLPAMQHWTRDHNIPVLSVTHDVDEALLLHADVIRLDHGRVLAQGPAAEVLAPDRDRLLAALR